MLSSKASMAVFTYSIINPSLDPLLENKTWTWSLGNKPMEFKSEGQFFQLSSKRKRKASNDCELHFINAKLIYILNNKA
jgi:hypothetical protein